MSDDNCCFGTATRKEVYLMARRLSLALLAFAAIAFAALNGSSPWGP